jgi:putative hydrolase of the HAD superfamily
MLKAPTGDTESVAGVALFDLDNTLLDREAAFAVWAKSFIEANRLPPDAWSIIESTDEDGFKPRDLFFSEIQEALGVTTSLDELLDRYYVDYPACYSVDDETVEAIRNLRASDWKVGVVTNGPPSQWAKFEATKLVKEFDGICISAAVGARKPNIEIFQEASRICDVPLEGWMVGDSASDDIGGGMQAGLRTIWIARGRTWDVSEYEPDAVVATVSEAAAVILGLASTTDS